MQQFQNVIPRHHRVLRVQRVIRNVRLNFLRNWSWFEDYSGPAGRIWLAWCLISVLYGDYELIPRRELWGGLRTLAVGISDEPWLVLGDFNAVLDDSEVRGRAADTMREQGALWKRLDRMLVNEAWLEKWPGSSYISALPSTSDHSPLIISGTNGEAERPIFRFDNYLAQLPGFLSSVDNIWKHHITGTEMYGVVCKLKALKTVFRRQRKQKGNLTENVKLAKAYLDKAQELFAVYRDDILLHLVKCCRMVYSEAIKLEMSMLKQRAKLRWMKHGDQNSRVFFRKINSKRAKHMIFQITNATGEVLTDKHAITEEFVSYFQTLLGGCSTRIIDLSFLRTELKHTLTLEEASFLIRPVTREEIKEAIFDIDEESAPGPDGYTSAFFRTAWPVVGQAISEAICEFFRTGQLLKQVNTTLLALIPKVNLPSYVSDYRPISCCNVLYKAITKVIVKRMQPILHLLIDFSQTAFVPGRSIADNILLAQTPGWFVGWIEQCVTTASFSVSLNGAIYGFFKGSRGLRQGDPVSPYLFVLVMETWNSLLKYRVQNAADFQYHWKCKEMGILNLCFADDVLLF
ncbi:UNVERIFIED_CONTAM: hypothetical protein Scaly_2907800, partial [Sesamum calycinum]